jgi:hypothetical protein
LTFFSIDVEDERSIELFVIGSVGAFDTSVVLFTALRDFDEPRIEGREVGVLEIGQDGWIAIAKFFSPVGLPSERCGDPHGAQVGGNEEKESDTVGSIERTAVTEEAQAGCGFTEGPLIARDGCGADMLPTDASQGVFVEDIFHIDLGECKGFFVFPSPERWIERFAETFLAMEALSTEDVANGMR